MSRIDEALRQARGKAPVPDAPSEPAATLETFPIDPPLGAPVSEPVMLVDPEPPVSSNTISPAFVERLVIHQNAEAVVVEQYRRLAAVLHQAQAEREIKVVMVASAQAAEGKTLTAANLALTLSESHRRRVLLVDADLRRPSLGMIFQLPATAGLSESLKSEHGLPLEVIHLSASLALLPGGSADSDPMAGLTSGRMQQIIQQAVTGFDWVILDTPPVALLSDAHLLAAMVDAAVLVIDAGATPCAMVQRAIESIGRAKIVGVVLNRVEDSVLAGARYYDYRDSPYGGYRRRYLSQPPAPPNQTIPSVPETAR